MKWQGRQRSTNVDDRRGKRSVGRGGKLGLGGVIIVVILMLIMGENPLGFLVSSGVNSMATSTEQTYIPTEEEDQLAEFVSVVLKDTEDVWTVIFRQEMNSDYPEPTLVLFTDQVTSRCGMASAATGPFYCPGDDQVYIDLSFNHELSERFGAPGDFAMAYVVAHEVGHHIQNILGTTRILSENRGKLSKAEYNELSVKLELQADFYAGVWAHHAQKMKNILEPGDIKEALNAAAAIGDDRLQKQAQGYVVPESFTHGTSEQRVRWFSKGFQSGDIRQGDTFSADAL